MIRTWSMASPEEQSFVMNRQNSHKPLTHPTPWVALHKIEGFAVWVSGIIYETRLFSHQSSDNLFFFFGKIVRAHMCTKHIPSSRCDRPEVVEMPMLWMIWIMIIRGPDGSDECMLISVWIRKIIHDVISKHLEWPCPNDNCARCFDNCAVKPNTNGEIVMK